MVECETVIGLSNYNLFENLQNDKYYEAVKSDKSYRLMLCSNYTICDNSKVICTILVDQYKS